MAESATSVGSLTFLGLFAISQPSFLYAFWYALRERPLRAPEPAYAPCGPKRPIGRLCPLTSGEHPIGCAVRMKWSQLTQSSSSLTAQSDKALRTFEIPRDPTGIVVAIRRKQGKYAALVRPVYSHGRRNSRLTTSCGRKKVGILSRALLRSQGNLPDVITAACRRPRSARSPALA